MRREALHLLAGAVLLAAVSGCTLKQVAVRTSTAVLDDIIGALNAEPDPAHARRAAPSLLVMTEGFLRADPDNAVLRRAAAQAYGGFAFAFLEPSEPARARRFYRRGLDHGLRALKALPGMTEGLEGGPDRLRRALRGLGREEVPLLFWTAYCWSGWINLSRNNPDAVADLPRAEALMARVAILDPGFFYGGPDLFYGVYYGGRPKMLGGDPRKARAHFERAIAASGGRFLMAKVLYARTYAVRVQDRALFLRLLGEVASAPPGLLPPQALANAIARRRARELRKNVDDYF